MLGPHPSDPGSSPGGGSVVGEVWMVEVKLTSFGLIARSAIV